MGKRDSYDGEMKLKVIQWIRDHGEGIPTRATKQFKLPPGTMRTWWSNRTGIVEASSSSLKRKRSSGGGHPGVFIQFDDELADIILNLRAAKERVTRQTV